MNNHGSTDIITYPNPVNDRLQVEIFSEEATDIQYRIINQAGIIVAGRSLKITGGRSSTTINTAALSKGMYYLVFTSEGFEQRNRFIKL